MCCQMNALLVRTDLIKILCNSRWSTKTGWLRIKNDFFQKGKNLQDDYSGLLRLTIRWSFYTMKIVQATFTLNISWSKNTSEFISASQTLVASFAQTKFFSMGIPLKVVLRWFFGAKFQMMRAKQHWRLNFSLSSWTSLFAKELFRTSVTGK